MVNFITLDLTLLVLFTIFVVIFLYTRKHNLKREGLMYLYRTKLGIKFIEWTSRKYSKILKPMQYLVIASGYILMVIMIFLLVKTLFIYFQQPADSPISKVPAVFPLIPYFPQIFNLDSFFPPFYFVYFIIAIAIIAVCHEFSHGIFARLNKIRILSTGFAFLGPFLGAFVEQDDKQMWKAKKIPQMAILAAGTFANVLVALFFILVMAVFFALVYSPAGFSFDSYSISVINASGINSVENISVNGQTFYKLNLQNNIFFAEPKLFSYALAKNLTQVVVFEDTPAFRAGLRGAIIQMDQSQIKSREDLQKALEIKNPKDNITIQTFFNNSVETYSISLGERDGRAFLGVGIYPAKSSGISGAIYKSVSLIKKPNVYYKSRIGNLADFIYDLLWWIIIINFLVALFNMYPAGILDGGRFLLITVWGITGNKKYGEYVLKFMTWLLLAVIALMMVKWVFNLL